MNVKNFSWEYADDGMNIIIRKKRGRLTLDDLMEYMHEPQLASCFEGAIVMFMFRARGELSPQYLDDDEKPQGDEQFLWIMDDTGQCPICGNQDIAVQYCPDCGRKLFGGTEDKKP